MHIDFFGLTRTTCVSAKLYGLVILDDYTRWTWIKFLIHIDEVFEALQKLYKGIEGEEQKKGKPNNSSDLAENKSYSEGVI